MRAGSRFFVFQRLVHMTGIIQYSSAKINYYA